MEQHLFMNSKIFGEGSFFEKYAFSGAGILFGGENDGGGGVENNFEKERNLQNMMNVKFGKKFM